MTQQDQIYCPHCRQAYAATPQQLHAGAGQTIQCSNCQEMFTVPGGAGPVSYPTAQPPATNGLAVAGLVSGILGMVVPILPGALAIVLSTLALLKARRPGAENKRLALAGLILGIVGLVLTSALIVMLYKMTRELI